MGPHFQADSTKDGWVIKEDHTECATDEEKEAVLEWIRLHCPCTYLTIAVVPWWIGGPRGFGSIGEALAGTPLGRLIGYGHRMKVGGGGLFQPMDELGRYLPHSVNPGYVSSNFTVRIGVGVVEGLAASATPGGVGRLGRAPGGLPQTLGRWVGAGLGWWTRFF